jgi:hypothetical protein
MLANSRAAVTCTEAVKASSAKPIARGKKRRVKPPVTVE